MKELGWQEGRGSSRGQDKRAHEQNRASPEASHVGTHQGKGQRSEPTWEEIGFEPPPTRQDIQGKGKLKKAY